LRPHLREIETAWMPLGILSEADLEFHRIRGLQSDKPSESASSEIELGHAGGAKVFSGHKGLVARNYPDAAVPGIRIERPHRQVRQLAADARASFPLRVSTIKIKAMPRETKIGPKRPQMNCVYVLRLEGVRWQVMKGIQPNHREDIWILKRHREPPLGPSG
jgi:hypothetical protein